MSTVGVLALQGDFERHIHALQRLGVEAIEVRTPEQLIGVDGLIIPGGESTALLKLMAPLNWFSAIQQFHAAGRGIFGTCAGMIVLANQVIPKQDALGLIDCVVARNAYGRQLDSHVAEGQCHDPALPASMQLVFIRAPQIQSVGPSVKTLVTCGDTQVCLRQDNVMVASFHPEMLAESSLHDYFCREILAVSLGNAS